MAYDLDLANRIRECIGAEPGLSEQQMFGGLGFLINGNMSVSASRQGGLLLRIEPAQTEKLVTRAHAEPFVMRGREMSGWLRVDSEGVRTKRDLARWVSLGVDYARSLPPKRGT
jgi:hypothetical protein